MSTVALYFKMETLEINNKSHTKNQNKHVIFKKMPFK